VTVYRCRYLIAWSSKEEGKKEEKEKKKAGLVKTREVR